MRHLGLDATVAGHIHLPAAVHSDDAHVLDTGLGAVARAAAHGELDLVRRIHAPHRALQVLAHLGAVLRAHAAPLAAHAGFDCAQRLGIGVAGWHANVFPHVLQVFFLDAQEVDTLAARYLDGGYFVFVHHIGNATQFTGRGLAAPHARDHAVGAVFLDVGVAAFVDEAALRIVLGGLGPGADQVVVDSRAARCTTIWRLPIHELKGVGNGEYLVVANRIAHGLVAVVGAAAHGLGFGRGRIITTRCEHDDLFYQPCAGAAGCAGLGVLAHLFQGEQALVLDGLADGTLADAIATADLGRVGHGGSLAVAFVAGVANVAFTKHQLVANVADRATIAQQFEVPAAVHRVAIQAGTDQFVVLDD